MVRPEQKTYGHKKYSDNSYKKKPNGKPWRYEGGSHYNHWRHPRWDYPTRYSYRNVNTRPIPYRRPPSPKEGSEEFLQRKIQKTSSEIMKHLLNPQEIVSENATIIIDDEIIKEDPENKQSAPEKKAAKPAHKTISEQDIQKVHLKVMSHISNLTEGRKKNLINSHSSEYDTIIQQIAKQKRLELSRAFRDAVPENSQNKADPALILPDTGINLETLPRELIEALKNTITLEPEELEALNWNVPKEVSSLNDNVVQEKDKEVVTIKTEPYDEDEYKNIINVESSPESTFNNNRTTNEGIVIEEPPTIKEEISNEVPQESNIIDLVNDGETNFVEDWSSSTSSPKSISELFGSEDVFIKTESESTGPTNDTISTVTIKLNTFPATFHNYCTNLDKTPVSSTSMTETPVNDVQSLDPQSNETSFSNRVSQIFDETEDLPCNNASTLVPSQDLPEVSKETNNSQVATLESPRKSTRCKETQTIPQVTETTRSSLKDILNVYLQNQKEIVGLEQSINTMLDIDEAIQMLTTYRQSLFLRFKEQKSQEKKDCRSVKRKLSPMEISPEPVIENHIQHEPCLLFDFKKFMEKILMIKIVDDMVVTSCESGKILFFSTLNGCIIDEVKVSTLPVVAFESYENECLFVSSLEKPLYRYDFSFKNIKAIRTHFVYNVKVQCMEIAWKFIFLGCLDGSLLRYNIEEEKFLSIDKISDTNVFTLKAVKEGGRKVLLIGTRNSNVCVRDAMSGLVMRIFDCTLLPTIYNFILDQSIVYCATTNHQILSFSFNDGKLIQSSALKTLKGGVNILKILGGKYLFAGCYNGNIFVFTTKTLNFVCTIDGPGGVILGMEIWKNQLIVSTMSYRLKSIPIPSELCT